MITRKRILLLAAVNAAFLLGGAARDGDETSPPGETSLPAVETREPFDARRVLDLLYINRVDSALALVHYHRGANPKDPYVLVLEAKILRERLNDEDNNKELIRRAAEPIHAVLDSAIALSNVALKRDTKDHRQHYYRGYGWLSKAQLYVLTRSYWSAGRAASRGKADLERYLEKYPDDADARGLLGTYFYFADALPGFIKIVAKLFLIPTGDRDKGLDMLRYATNHDGALRTDWRFVMAAIDLVFEGNFEKGVDEFVELLEEYPYYTRLAEPIGVVAPLYPTRTRELTTVAAAAVDRHLTLDENLIDWDLVKRMQLLRAFTDLYFGPAQKAVEQFTALIDDPPQHPDWVLPIALLNRGFMDQKTGNTDDATRAFDVVTANARATYYRRGAEAMRGSIDKPVKTIDLAGLDFIPRIYEGEFDEAAEMLERSREIHGEDVIYDFYSGDLDVLRGDFASARRAYDRALSRETFGGEQIYQMLSAVRLAELSGFEGRYSEARDLLKRARSYTFANYLLDFLVESRRRYYELLERDKIREKPVLLVHQGTRDG